MIKNTTLENQANEIAKTLWAFAPKTNKNKAFHELSLVFLSALIYPLLYVHKLKGRKLYVATIYKYTTLEKAMLLAGFPKKKPIRTVEIPDDVTLPLKSYLRALPEFNEKRKRQNNETLKHHEFSQIDMNKIMCSIRLLEDAGMMQ